MDIKIVLKNRRAFSSSFQKYIKMILDGSNPLYKKEVQELHFNIINHFDKFHNDINLLKEQYLSLESQLQDFNLTIKQVSKTSMNSDNLDNIKQNLIKKKTSIKERIEKTSIRHLSLSNSMLEKFENHMFLLLTSNTKEYPEDLVRNTALLEKGFPLLIDFCYKWEADNIFNSSKITQDSRNLLIITQKSLKNINKLKTMPNPFFDTKEYKQLSESLPIISKSIDSFTEQESILNFLTELSQEHPKITGFLTIFTKKDFKSIRSRIRMFSTLEKTEELIKIVKSEFRSLEQLLSVYLYQLEIQKKEILKICLQSNDYKQYILQQWIKKEFASQFNDLKNIQDEYERKLLKF